VNGLRDAQTTGIHERGGHARGRVADTAQELTDFMAAEDDGQLLVAFDAEQIEQRPRALERAAKEELDGEEVNSYGALGQAARLGQVDEEVADVVLRQEIGGSVEVPGQVLDGLDVGALGAFGQAGEAHVLDHTTA